MLELSQKEYQDQLTQKENSFAEKERLLKQKEEELLNKERQLQQKQQKLKQKESDFEKHKTIETSVPTIAPVTAPLVGFGTSKPSETESTKKSKAAKLDVPEFLKVQDEPQAVGSSNYQGYQPECKYKKSLLLFSCYCCNSRSRWSKTCKN